MCHRSQSRFFQEWTVGLQILIMQMYSLPLLKPGHRGPEMNSGASPNCTPVFSLYHCHMERSRFTWRSHLQTFCQIRLQVGGIVVHSASSQLPLQLHGPPLTLRQPWAWSSGGLEEWAQLYFTKAWTRISIFLHLKKELMKCMPNKSAWPESSWLFRFA